MRIVDVRERTVEISRYSDPAVPSGGLTTSIVALTTDVVRHGRSVVGFGFSSFGRFGQGGLIRERFAPRLTAAGEIDPLKGWAAMMKGEKPGGHGERCVAVGTLDMALWDAAAKIADLPLQTLLRQRFGDRGNAVAVPVYASGGYPYPADDFARLKDELRRFHDTGYLRAKVKIGTLPLPRDIERVSVAAEVFAVPQSLAVDAMNSYAPEAAVTTAKALRLHQLMWLEDVCDPLDFEGQSTVTAAYEPPIAAGEPLFSAAEAKLLDRHGGLRRDRDILLFDPVHCYGLPGYLQIVETLEARGWKRSAFWPHGGHLFSLHVASALGLGGTEVNPSSFPPFGGLADNDTPSEGCASPPERPGIGFESQQALDRLFRSLL
ncbi:MAG: mandelate racemase [Alphaproteobacteria bacterium]|nr:mandelate racemase [Alphaproteobacteria bacterium]